MTQGTLRIATRRSKLALWQAEWVSSMLRELHPELTIELVHVVTKGDKILDVPLAQVGGKGLFVKEIEDALLEGRADIAVHSMKDVPAELPEGLHLPVICEREDPRDAWCSGGVTLDALPAGAVVGTSSLRRQVQLRARRADVELRTLRGNVDTRLRKLADGEYDAIVLAAAGLKRLEVADRITAFLETDEMLPAVGQGAVGIESRGDDAVTNALIAPLRHDDTMTCVRAERAFLARLEGGCQVPIACHGVIEGDALWLRGLIGDVDGRLVRDERRGPRARLAGPAEPHTRAEALGVELADALLAAGGKEILERAYSK